MDRPFPWLTDDPTMKNKICPGHPFPWLTDDPRSKIHRPFPWLLAPKKHHTKEHT